MYISARQPPSPHIVQRPLLQPNGALMNVAEERLPWLMCCVCHSRLLSLPPGSLSRSPSGGRWFSLCGVPTWPAITQNLCSVQAHELCIAMLCRPVPLDQGPSDTSEGREHPVVGPHRCLHRRPVWHFAIYFCKMVTADGTTSSNAMCIWSRGQNSKYFIFWQPTKVLEAYFPPDHPLFFYNP